MRTGAHPGIAAGLPFASLGIGGGSQRTPATGDASPVRHHGSAGVMAVGRKSSPLNDCGDDRAMASPWLKHSQACESGPELPGAHRRRPIPQRRCHALEGSAPLPSCARARASRICSAFAVPSGSR